MIDRTSSRRASALRAASAWAVAGAAAWAVVGAGASCKNSEAAPEGSGSVVATSTPPPSAPSIAPSAAATAASNELWPSPAASVEVLADAGPDAQSRDGGGDAGDAGDAGDGDAGTSKPRACPPEMASVGRFCVDLYEGHLVSVSDGGEVIFAYYQRPEKGTRYEARSSADVFPQAYISRVESAQACKNAGKRLCSRAEWIRACEGPKHLLYPYGNEQQSRQCNSGKIHLLPQLFGQNPKAWKYDENFNSPLLNQEPGYLAKSGSYAQCISGVGVLDLVGNLHEWVSDTVDEDIEEKLALDKVTRREQPWRVGNGIFMGGFFSTTSELGAGCYYTTIAHEPTYHDYSTGFRCCKDAERPRSSKEKAD